MKNLEISFKDNRTGHSDIVLKTIQPKKVRKFDSFYFIIASESETINGAKELLIETLEFWEKSIREIKEDEIEYLPIDFSDEYLGVFKVTVANQDKINLEFGFTQEIHGYSTSIPNFKRTTFSDAKFIKDLKSSNLIMKKGDLLDDLRLSIEKIALTID